MIDVKFLLMSPRSREPKYATVGSAAADLYSAQERTLLPGETVVVDTGVAVELPGDTVGLVMPRSSMSKKQLPAEVGTIDSDYRGPIGVTLTNHSKGFYTVHVGDRIGQLLILPCVRAHFVESSELSDTARGAGGFGSTGR